jgi:hypothetical protein
VPASVSLNARGGKSLMADNGKPFCFLWTKLSSCPYSVSCTNTHSCSICGDSTHSAGVCKYQF